MQLSKICSLLILVACAGFIAPRIALPQIGRTGNLGTDSLAITDFAQGYRAKVPTDFSEINIADEGSAALNSNYLLDPEFGNTEMIQATPFEQVYPELVGDNSAAVEAYFNAASGMTYSEVSSNNCALSLLGEGSNTWVGIVTWGNGNGYTAVGPKTNEAKQAILYLIANTVIDGPCWK